MPNLATCKRTLTCRSLAIHRAAVCGLQAFIASQLRRAKGLQSCEVCWKNSKQKRLIAKARWPFLLLLLTSSKATAEVVLYSKLNMPCV